MKLNSGYQSLTTADSKKRILVGPVEWPREGVRVEIGSHNPGLGGTEFMAAQVAMMVASKDATCVELWCVGSQPGDLRGVRLKDTTEVLCSRYDTLISPAYYAVKYRKEIASVGASRKVVWSHHPHDPYLKSTQYDSVVFTSRYGYWSTWPHSGQAFFIRNPWAPRSELASQAVPRDLNPEKFSIGFVGALHPGKGFHYIARNWQSVVQKVPNVTLEVVGAASLYGRVDSHPTLPTTLEYGEVLLKELGSDWENTISFLGRVDTGVDDIVKQWDLAIANPTGETESDPATIKNYLRLGVPVIGAHAFGQYELLRAIPFTRLRQPEDLPNVIESLWKNRDRIELMRRAGLELADRLERESEGVIAGWLGVIDGRKLSLGKRVAQPPFDAVAWMAFWHRVVLFCRACKRLRKNLARAFRILRKTARGIRRAGRPSVNR